MNVKDGTQSRRLKNPTQDHNTKLQEGKHLASKNHILIKLLRVEGALVAACTAILIRH
jgi:hypothetical protein